RCAPRPPPSGARRRRRSARRHCCGRVRSPENPSGFCSLGEAGSGIYAGIVPSRGFVRCMPRLIPTPSKESFLGVVLSFEESPEERNLITPLVEATAAGMERVNRLVIERTGSDVALIPEVARYLIDSGGKRLRPMVTVG